MLPQNNTVVQNARFVLRLYLTFLRRLGEAWLRSTFARFVHSRSLKYFSGWIIKLHLRPDKLTSFYFFVFVSMSDYMDGNFTTNFPQTNLRLREDGDVGVMFLHFHLVSSFTALTPVFLFLQSSDHRFSTSTTVFYIFNYFFQNVF